MIIVYTLIFTALVQDIGPVTTRIDYPSLAACDQARIQRMMAVGDRMMHAACEPKQVTQ